MRNRLLAFGLVLILSAVLFGGCAPSTARPTESPTVRQAPTEGSATPVTEQPTETPSPVESAETWVYVDLTPDESGTTVTWIDSLSGIASSVPAPGTR